MLAVADENLRSNGIGKELKIVQAYHAKQNGYNSMKWLYDPERGGNASLNIRKLGAMAEEFYIDKYGEMRSGLYETLSQLIDSGLCGDLLSRKLLIKC